ncbi:cAMP-binding domain of CRP or a regulatory subunit of cAMP-dependent protein kinases [Salinimicrobium sediminis]|uniref:cAMP-binding domain of CRP or a regulatory subunit of cAMP-dependent protein kinases n=1 Tax=Salinimicrobium sediminis TaxID=1343891 RepID=A0A285X4P7_9FLAO|nr:Crp/Fnr family transcriptional regulator [Salinimicrobium sediminis]SOC79744.1 cAMP-binding domain of CRP or a regulatory subunit of cAMP-dependent protein kinases [Salinimicrobium sediminis]
MNLSIFLKQVVDFSSEELEDIVSHFEKESVQKNEILVREGQICSKLYFIEKGVGRSYYLKEDGMEITQWFFIDGKIMSSIESFFQQVPSIYYLEMLEDSVIYSITRERLDMLFARYHNMEKFGRLLSTEMLTRVVNKLNALQFQTARERYEYMLKEFPDISTRVSLGFIASYLGMTQETLSRIRRNDSKKS